MVAAAAVLPAAGAVSPAPAAPVASVVAAASANASSCKDALRYRSYALPPGALINGSNTLAVRVFSPTDGVAVPSVFDIDITRQWKSLG